MGKISHGCLKIVLQSFYLARIWRPDILWYVNKLARAVIKWTEACDKRLARVISYLHLTNDYRQYCHVGNTAKHCRLGLFQDQTLLATLQTLNQPREREREESCVSSEVEHLFP